jgi:hypothetical protein
VLTCLAGFFPLEQLFINLTPLNDPINFELHCLSGKILSLTVLEKRFCYGLVSKNCRR